MKNNRLDQLVLIQDDSKSQDPPPLEFDKPVSLIHITNTMTPHQRKGFNAILVKAKQQLSATVEPNEDPLHKVIIPWMEFKDLIKLKHRTRSYAMEKLSELQKITVEIDILGKEGVRKELRSLQLISEVRFVEGKFDTEIVIYLPPTIKERLRESDITAVLDIRQMAKLDTKYATPLYELSKEALKYSGGAKTKFKFDIEEVRKLFGIVNEYERAYDLKNRCIDPAVREIESMTNMRCTYEFIRSGVGRRIIAVEFEAWMVEECDEEILKFTVIFNEVIGYVRRGYQDNVQICQYVERYLREKNKEYVVTNIEYSNKISTKNYVKFLKDALDNDYAVNDRVLAQQLSEQRRDQRDRENELENQLAQKEADEGIKYLAHFETLSSAEKDRIYEIIDKDCGWNTFLRLMSSEQQIIAVLRKEMGNLPPGDLP